MPSQQQLKWSELRVGITVIFAAVVLATLIFLMSGTGTWTPKITLITYFDNAEQLRVGAPVSLQGVKIGNVKSIRVVPSKPLTPVEVVMRVTTGYQTFLRKDTTATVETAGILGDAFIDLDSTHAKGVQVKDGDVLPSGNAPGIQDVVRASQTTLQNLDVLIRRLDNIVSGIEKGEGSLGKVLNDPSLFNKANAILGQMQGLLNDIKGGKGTIGKLFADDELYRKANDSIAKLNHMMDEIERGQGTLGKIMKDPGLYDETKQTVAKANKLLDDVNAGKGALGKLTKDEELAKKLENTIARLSSLMDKMDQGEGTVALLFKDPALYKNTDQLLTETRGLIKAIHENPKKYLTIHFKIF